MYETDNEMSSLSKRFSVLMLRYRLEHGVKTVRIAQKLARNKYKVF